jgi:diacylglycerol kinase family enzyme
MQQVTIIHNPGSGDESFSKKELINMVEKAGYTCRYSSTKEDGWKDIDADTTLLVVAGGDGTVRKVASLMLNRKLKDKTLPVALLPLGTANNIAKTLGVNEMQPKDIIAHLQKAHLKCFDIGRVYNVKDHDFFMESFGFGIFPYLMKKMKKREEEEKPATAEAELQMAVETLYNIILEYEPRQCHLTVDGTDHSGKFLLAEIMNIKSIGPNLELAPLADPTDGEFEIVLVPESHKAKFAAFVKEMLEGKETSYTFHTLKGNDIKIQWQGTHVHIDDKIVKIEENTEVEVVVKRGVLIELKMFYYPLIVPVYQGRVKQIKSKRLQAILNDHAKQSNYTSGISGSTNLASFSSDSCQPK